jgi:nucleotide-binding universal stress UspA family protein
MHGRKVSVLVVDDDEVKGQQHLDDVEKEFGDCCDKFQFIKNTARVSDIIMEFAENQSVDMIIMGGYGFPPFLELLLGSTVDAVLRETRIPVLICK